MTLQEIAARYSMLRICEERQTSDKYREVVFYTQDMDEWIKISAEIFGPAIKPGGSRPTRDDQKLTKDYGGIREDQTLFKMDGEDATVIAMFWPWQQEYVTLKIVFLKKD